LAAIGAIFASCQTASGFVVSYLVDAYSDRSMIEKLYSVDKEEKQKLQDGDVSARKFLI